jgi:rubredoxin
MPEGVPAMTPGKMRFYPKKEEFPDDILCPLCKNQKQCESLGDRSCVTVMAMCKDMEAEPGGFLQ